MAKALFPVCGKCGEKPTRSELNHGFCDDCLVIPIPGQLSFNLNGENMSIEIDEWNNLYPSKWKEMIVEESFAHPAKFSNKLIRKIYDHMVQEGWLKPGDTVIDPFGGVALGALDAMRHGLIWRGVELEERFVPMGNANIAFWDGMFHVLPKWSGDAMLLQGDSRKLLEVLAPWSIVAASIISSPPYAGMEIEKNSKSIDLEKMYEVYKKSGGGQTYEAFCATQNKHSGGYQVAISSPPYADARIQQDGSNNSESMRRPTDKGRYGTESAQLGAMKATEKGFQAAISSPPFMQTSGGKNVTATEGPLADKALLDRHAAGNMAVGYGETEGNMGRAVPDEFWSSAKTIVEQVYLALEPGGHASWVVKDFVKGGKRIEFCRMWRELCESVGFVTLHEHRAMLVKDNGASQDFDGKIIEHKKSAKSFFRRIAEKKGSPAIDYEIVFCMVKPAWPRVDMREMVKMKETTADRNPEMYLNKWE